MISRKVRRLSVLFVWAIVAESALALLAWAKPGQKLPSPSESAPPGIEKIHHII